MSYITDNFGEYAQHLPTCVADTWEDFISFIVSFDSNGVDVTLTGDLTADGTITANTYLYSGGDFGLAGDIKMEADKSILWDDDGLLEEFLRFYSADATYGEIFKVGNDSFFLQLRSTKIILGQSTAKTDVIQQNTKAYCGFETDNTTERDIGLVNNLNEICIGDVNNPIRFYHDGNVYGLDDLPWWETPVWSPEWSTP